MYASTENQRKGKIVQNSDVICPNCGKKHEGRPYYRDIEACFGYEKKGHKIRDYSKDKKFMTRKPKEKNKENKQKLRAQGQVFTMTHRDAHDTFDVVTRTIQIHTLFARALIDLGLTHFFILVSFIGL